jgi:two-component system nitrogen regulation response regulator GlnG
MGVLIEVMMMMVGGFDDLAPAGPLSDAVSRLAETLFAAQTAAVHRQVLALVERHLLAHALDRTRGNQLRAARLLGINRNTLHKRCRQLGLPLARTAGSR